MVLEKYSAEEPVEVCEPLNVIDSTVRGSAGFGSTGDTTPRDAWVKRGRKVERVHHVPRRAPFSPVGVRGTPSGLKANRTTEVWNSKGDVVQVFEDDWSAQGTPLPLPCTSEVSVFGALNTLTCQFRLRRVNDSKKKLK